MRSKLVVIVLALLLACPAFAQKTHASDAAAIHNSLLVIDTHADTPGRFVDEQFDPGTDAGKGHWDLARAKAGNLGAEFFSIWVDPEKYKGREAHRALDMIDSVYQVAAEHPDKIVMAYSTADIKAARSGPHPRIAALMGVEGGHAIEGDIRILRDFYRLGVRYMTLTWMNSNDLAQSSGDVKTGDDGKPIDPGLTDLGRDVVREMNRLGMMVDISHVSDRTFYNTLVVSRAPVIASHSSSRAVSSHFRNMTDDMLVALARNGGVAQVNFECSFISNDYRAQLKQWAETHPEEIKHARELWHQPHTPETMAELEKFQAMRSADVPRPPFSILIDHFDHMIKVAGVDHVGVGSDFDGIECLPQGMDGVQDLPKITAALLQRGYSKEDVRKVMGGNLMRVFGDVERVAHQMQSETNPDQRVKSPFRPQNKRV